MKRPLRRTCSKFWWLAASVAFFVLVLIAPGQITISPPDGGTNGSGTINTNATLDPTNAVLKNIISTLALTNTGRILWVATNGNPLSTGGLVPFDTVSNAVWAAIHGAGDTIVILPGDHFWRAPTNTVVSAAIQITNYPGRLTIMGLGWGSRMWSDREGTCFVVSNTGPVTFKDFNLTGFRQTDVANVFGPGPGIGIAVDTMAGDIRFENMRFSDFQRFGGGFIPFNATPFTNNFFITSCQASNCGSWYPNFLGGLYDGAGFQLGPNTLLVDSLVVNSAKGIEIYGNDFAATNRPNSRVRVVTTRFRNIIANHVFNGGYSNNLDVTIRGCSFIDDPSYVRYDGSNYITGGTPTMFNLSLMQNLQFDDNFVQPHYAVGLSLTANAQDMLGARVRRNKFIGMHAPIQAGDATGGTSPGMRDLVIDDNDFYDFGGRGIQLIGVRDSIVKNNRFHNGSTNGTLANIYIAGTAPAAHSSNILVEANSSFDFNSTPGNSYGLEIAAGSIDIKMVNNDWSSFATAAFIDGGTNTLIIGRNQTGVGIGTNVPNQRLVVVGNVRIEGTNSAKKFHGTDGSNPTNTIAFWNNSTNIGNLQVIGGIVSNGFLVIPTNVAAGASSSGGSITSSNIILYGNFGHLSNTNPFSYTHPGAPNIPLTNFSGFQGSNFSATASHGFITNHMPSGFVDINATVNIGDPDSTREFWFSVMTNGVASQLESFFLSATSGGNDEFTMSVHGSLYLPTNVTVSIALNATTLGSGVIINSHYLTVRSYDYRFDVLIANPPGLIAAGDIMANTVYVTNGYSMAVTNLGNAASVAMVWNGPQTIRWGPTNNGSLTGGGTAPGAGDPARSWTIEIYPGGYTNLVFPGAFGWIDGGPFYDPSRTNFFEVLFTGSNYLAHSVNNGTLSAASANISGHWIAPPLGIIGGSVNSQFRSNLTANALFTVSNLLHETELEIIANGPQASILNSNSIVWMEGSEPFIPTNGRTLLRFWPTAGVTNGMVLSGQVFNLTNGTDISFVRDIPNKTITIHYTGSGGGGGSSLVVNSDQFDYSTGILAIKPSYLTTNSIQYGGITVLPDPATGDGGSVAASYISSTRYIDVGVTNLGNGNAVTMIWNGPSFIRWWPTNNGVLTGGGTAPQLGDSARIWRISILACAATNITFPSNFQWTDGGPFYTSGLTNLYEIQFTSSNYLARRIAPAPIIVQPYVIREEFLGGTLTSGSIGTHGWQALGLGMVELVKAGYYGVLRCSSLGTSNQFSTLILGVDGMIGGTLTNIAWTNKTILGLPNGGSFSNTTLRVGWVAGANSVVNSNPPTDAIYLCVSNNFAPGNWFGILANGGTETIVNTGVTASTPVALLTNEVRSTGNGQISFAVNGTASSPLSGASALGMRPFVTMVKTFAVADTDNKNYHIDYWEWAPVLPGR